MLWQSIDKAFRKLIAKVAGKHTYETVFVAHSGNPERCQEFIDYFKSLPNAPKEILMAEVGPAVGVHVGPNTIGFVWVGENALKKSVPSGRGAVQHCPGSGRRFRKMPSGKGPQFRIGAQPLVPKAKQGQGRMRPLTDPGIGKPQAMTLQAYPTHMNPLWGEANKPRILVLLGGACLSGQIPPEAILGSQAGCSSVRWNRLKHFQHQFPGLGR